MDRIDRALLHELQVDAKITNAALAQKVNLSESACLRRVRNLESAGLIRGYVCLVDQSSAGFPDNVFVQITLHSQQRSDLDAFEKAIMAIPEVMECYHITGEDDYLLKVAVRDIHEYEEFILKKLAKLPALSKIKTSFVLSTVKYETKFPVKYLSFLVGKFTKVEEDSESLPLQHFYSSGISFQKKGLLYLLYPPGMKNIARLMQTLGNPQHASKISNAFRDLHSDQYVADDIK